MRLSLASTSTRTFVAIPLAVLSEQALRRRRLHLEYAPVLAWGYLQYRLSGQYRMRVGGGGPGMSNPPERLVTSGIYSVSRNPMYLGHLIFLSGLTLVTRSPYAAAVTVALVWWFDRRVQHDEKQVEQLFGDEYRRYAARVPRWLP